MHQENQTTKRRWRRKALAEHWDVSDRTVDRMVQDGRLGKPKYIGKRTPTWSDEQREAAEREAAERDGDVTKKAAAPPSAPAAKTAADATDDEIPF